MRMFSGYFTHILLKVEVTCDVYNKNFEWIYIYMLHNYKQMLLEGHSASGMILYYNVLHVIVIKYYAKYLMNNNAQIYHILPYASLGKISVIHYDVMTGKTFSALLTLCEESIGHR